MRGEGLGWEVRAWDERWGLGMQGEGLGCKVRAEAPDGKYDKGAFRKPGIILAFPINWGRKA